MPGPVRVVDADFDEKVLRSQVPVLVDFFGSWCGPCAKMKPVIDALAAELAPDVSVAQAEISEAPEAAARYDVMGVPTLILFAGGMPKVTLTGVKTKPEVLQAIEPYLTKVPKREGGS